MLLSYSLVSHCRYQVCFINYIVLLLVLETASLEAFQMLVSCNRLLHGSICCWLFVVWLHPEGTLKAVEEWDWEGAEGIELRALTVQPIQRPQ